MAKPATATRQAAGSAANDTIENSVVAFAEQLGRMVGTVQGRAEGWMDREALARQVAGIRDGAAQLLTRLSGRAAGGAKRVAPAPRRPASQRRSGGVVDAPGKKHRKPVVVAAPKNVAATQAAKLRAAKPMAKTVRRRGRG